MKVLCLLFPSLLDILFVSLFKHALPRVRAAVCILNVCMAVLVCGAVRMVLVFDQMDTQAAVACANVYLFLADL